MGNKKYNHKHFNKSSKGGDSETVVVSDKSSQYAHIEPVLAKPLEVTVYNNGFDKALRAFRALVQKERILSQYKEKQFYEKPSDRKRRKRNEMRRKLSELDSPREPSNRSHRKRRNSESTAE